jgi:hypothetical protein
MAQVVDEAWQAKASPVERLTRQRADSREQLPCAVAHPLERMLLAVY